MAKWERGLESLEGSMATEETQEQPAVTQETPDQKVATEENPEQTVVTEKTTERLNFRRTLQIFPRATAALQTSSPSRGVSATERQQAWLDRLIELDEKETERSRARRVGRGERE